MHRFFAILGVFTLATLCSCVSKHGPATTFKQAPRASVSDIFVLGTMHNLFFDPAFEYRLSDLEGIIKKVQPALICGEIFQPDFESNLEGYYPAENAVIRRVAMEIGATFLASDWRGSAVLVDEAEKLLKADPEKADSFNNTLDVKAVAGEFLVLA